MNLENGVYVLIAVVVFLIILSFFRWPIKLFWKLILNAGIGLALLLIFNFAGVYFKLSVPINWASILICGFFGIPGLIFLLIFLNM